MIDLNREEFEKLPEIAERTKRSEAFYCQKGDWYLSPYEGCREDEAFLEGAWYAFQKQQKKLDCCREENKAHLEKIDDLQARIDSLININESLVAYKNQLLEDIEEKGNKDEN